MRFQIFSENVDQIYASNARNRSYTLGITEHADQTFEEWRASHLSMNGFEPTLTAEVSNLSVFAAPKDFTEPAAGVDWVSKGGVTSVKSQGDCESCWTFAAVGAVEGAMFVAGRKLEELSMQHLLACAGYGQDTYGCDTGGSKDSALLWVGENGLPSLADEPYVCVDKESSECLPLFRQNRNGDCPTGKTMVIAPGDVTGVSSVDQTESALEAAVAQQPVAVSIEASSVFQHYTGGVLTDDACGDSTSHAVLAVGYGTDNGQKYWKVKNTWGTSFGEDGYIRIEKGNPKKFGECGIRERALFPTFKATARQVVV